MPPNGALDWEAILTYEAMPQDSGKKDSGKKGSGKKA
jgi:hypothetical protein